MLPGFESYTSQGADFDPERRYRYLLWRAWENEPRRTALWVMLNPSTADETVLDPTLKRVENFTRTWWYDAFRVVNLFAIRATDSGLLPSFDDPVGPANDLAIKLAAATAELIVVGWGSHKLATARARVVRELLNGRTLMCLGKNADGSPRHPLYLAATTQLEVWP